MSETLKATADAARAAATAARKAHLEIAAEHHSPIDSGWIDWVTRVHQADADAREANATASAAEAEAARAADAVVMKALADAET